MSAICQNFVQNAWKKELCSNCFKSKDEHNQTTIKKPLPISSDKVIESIIKSSLKNSTKTKKRTVSFTNELAEVIGYGGEDWSEVEDDVKCKDEDTGVEIDLEFNGEEDKELYRLTKANTDFNTVNANLLIDNTEMKKSYTHLKLGTPQIDSEGRKHTLLVSVTPFGQENNSLSLKKFSKSISHIPVAKNSKETIVESKTNAVLTSYTCKNEENIFKEEKSLLEEISETLEKSKTPIQIISRKKTQKDVVLTVSKIDAAEKNKENEKESSVVKTSSTYLLEKAAEKSTEKINDLKLNKSNIPERKNGLTRATVIKKDQEKPSIYQTSTAKIELLNSKNLKIIKETAVTNKTSKIETITKNNKTEDCEKNSLNNESANKSDENIIECKNVSTDSANNKDIDTSSIQTVVQSTMEPDIELKQNINHKRDQKESSTDVDSSEDSSAETANSLTESLAGEQENDPENHDLIIKSKLPPVEPSETREQAGEPDGHADPDGANEPPALPNTPPPAIETRSSFLHGNSTANDKPKLPLKPATVLIRKPVMATNQLIESQAQQHTLITFAVEAKIPEEQKLKLDKQDSNGSDVGRTANKRRAPKPPPLDEASILYSRNSSANMNIDSPVIREKDKRERAASCSPKLRNEVSNNPNGTISRAFAPEPAPRKSLSISTDSLAGVGVEEKKKEKSKGRFSLKKFLRMSSTKDLPKPQCESPKYEEVKFIEPQPKPRLVIVHPLELNGAKVEVVSKPVSLHEQMNYGLTMLAHQSEYQMPRMISSDHTIYEHRSVKPPPPPRNLDDWNRRNKPNLPHPPKSADIINKQKHIDKTHNVRKKNDSVYANIGEVRSAITPNKPQRTASMREREALAAQQQRHPSDNYEPIDVPSKEGKENVYDYINGARSSSPEYDDSSPDKNSPTNKTNKIHRCLRQARSSSNVDVSGDYFKFQNIPRSASLTYCGSETESEIYSPYSFYSSESEVAEDDRDWTTHNGRTYKLRSRKGRSIVHKNLEDNYGAVVVANHEALAQVLENIQQGPPIQPALRGLKTAHNLRWADFSVKENLAVLSVGPRIFHQVVWGAHHVTIVISTGSTPTSPQSLGTFNLVPITEFTDLVPAKYLPPSLDKQDVKLVQASIAVLPWMQVNTIQTYTDLLKSKSGSSSQEELFKDACFIVLQLVNALKMLQAQGIEELPLSLTSFVIYREMDKDSHHRLCVMQGLGEEITHKKENNKFGSLCLCATTVLTHLLPNARLTPLLRSLLNTERAVSLTQVKSILEFSLWGPSDVALSPNLRERELALQRWLDLQRATVLHGLVCTRIHLTVYEECHLLFLVRSNAKMMCDASLLLDSSNKQNMVTNGHK